MSVRQFNQYLSGKSSEQLTKELSDLYKNIPAVRDYYAMRMDDNGKQEVLAKFKTVIDQEFFPKRGMPNGRLSVVRKAVMDFKKLNGVNAELLELALYYVEVGVKFTQTYGDIDEPFYNSMESMYFNALKWAAQLQLLPNYQTQFLTMVHQTSEMGWGFHDGLLESYQQFYD